MNSNIWNINSPTDQRDTFFKIGFVLFVFNIPCLELYTSSCKTTAVSLMGFYIKCMRNERALTFGQSSVQIYLHEKDSYFLFLLTPNHAEAQFSHIPLNRAFLFREYHRLCVVGVFPWTEATCPTACSSNTCQHFAMSTKFQVQTYYIANSISSRCKKKSKTLPIIFLICHNYGISSLSIQVYLNRPVCTYMYVCVH